MTPTPLELLGTAEPPPERRELRAGPLTAVLEAGQLRAVRWHGVEALRGIAYLVRDAGWGTAAMELRDLEVREAPDRFAVAWRGRAEGPFGRLDLRAAIEGAAAGHLSFEVTATAETEVVTNRAGFVVLHPAEVAGRPLWIGHPEGRVEETAFPRLVAPDQPAFGILSLEHAPAPGVVARVAFEGGLWEMEDQRNWSDASFKTYVRPLAWPRPYVIPAGATDRQAVRLDLSGRPAPAEPVVRTEAPPLGRVPPLHLRLDERLPVPARLALPRLGRGLIARVRVEAPDPGRLRAAAALARAEGMGLMVEAVFPQADPEVEVAALLGAIESLPVEAILVAAARDLRTRPSSDGDAGEAPLAETVAALRRRFAGRIGAGVPAFFPELNRHPPPIADVAFWGITPLVHAADDRSVMETLETHPAILDSAAALCPGMGLWPGPLAIVPTVNPYGPGLAETDGATRTCLAARDPRHGALFGAAYLLGALAACLPRASAAAPVFATGPAGLAAEDGSPLPLAFVQAEVAAAEGAALRPVPQVPSLAALAWEAEGRRTLLLANLSEEAVDLPPLDVAGEAHLLAPGASGWVAEDAAPTRLGAYRTLRLRGPAP